MRDGAAKTARHDFYPKNGGGPCSNTPFAANTGGTNTAGGAATTDSATNGTAHAGTINGTGPGSPSPCRNRTTAQSWSPSSASGCTQRCSRGEAARITTASTCASNRTATAGRAEKSGCAGRLTEEKALFQPSSDRSSRPWNRLIAIYLQYEFAKLLLLTCNKGNRRESLSGLKGVSRRSRNPFFVAPFLRFDPVSSLPFSCSVILSAAEGPRWRVPTCFSRHSPGRNPAGRVAACQHSVQ